MIKVIMFIATGCHVGYLPKAPGTWGAALGLLVHYGLFQLSPGYYYGGLAVVFLMAVSTAGSAEKILDQGDPQVVVIDEIVGMLVTLIGAPAKPHVYLAGFLLFRFFDILKPFPINIIDQRLHGGLGIVLDDVMAGVYSLICLQILSYFLGWK